MKKRISSLWIAIFMVIIGVQFAFAGGGKQLTNVQSAALLPTKPANQ